LGHEVVDLHQLQDFPVELVQLRHATDLFIFRSLNAKDLQAKASMRAQFLPELQYSLGGRQGGP
jgi:hypothetical protein